MHDLIHSSIDLAITMINKIGYLGIFIGMFLESTLVPIPSELIMIPAGISAAKGMMNIYLVILIGTIGNICGAVFSYYLAMIVGRKVLLKIGKYFFIQPSTINKIELFFKKHGMISIFIGRLLPGFRHFISLPAGIARMDMKLFLLYTSLGAAIWTSILSLIGFLIGENEKIIAENLNKIIFAAVLFCIALTATYILRKPVRK